MSSDVAIDPDQLDATLADAPNWALLDNTLYDLCRLHPDHADRTGSNAKLWLIGRGFATGIERQIKSKNGQGSSMGALCDYVHDNQAAIDRVIRLLADVAEPLDRKKLNIIADAHGRLCRLLRPLLRKRVSPRSFAAKYLHFHCRAVPIYDSNAAWKLTGLCRWRREFNKYRRPKEADWDYHWFLVRFWHFYQAAKKLRPAVTVRQLDLYLLSPDPG